MYFSLTVKLTHFQQVLTIVIDPWCLFYTQQVHFSLVPNTVPVLLSVGPFYLHRVPLLTCCTMVCYFNHSSNFTITTCTRNQSEELVYVSSDHRKGQCFIHRTYVENNTLHQAYKSLETYSQLMYLSSYENLLIIPVK